MLIRIVEQVDTKRTSCIAQPPLCAQLGKERSVWAGSDSGAIRGSGSAKQRTSLPSALPIIIPAGTLDPRSPRPQDHHHHRPGQQVPAAHAIHTPGTAIPPSLFTESRRDPPLRAGFAFASRRCALLTLPHSGNRIEPTLHLFTALAEHAPRHHPPLTPPLLLVHTTCPPRRQPPGAPRGRHRR